jgi:tape measure domain-containing protein
MQNIVFNLKLNSKDFTTSVRGAGDALDGTKEKVKGVGDEAEKAGGKIKGTTNDVNNLASSIKQMAQAVGIGFGVQQIIQFGKEIAKANAEMEGLNIRMKGLHGDSEVANRAMAGLRDMANEYGLELKGLTANYLQFVSAAKASGTEVAKAEKIFKSMSVAIAGSGVSTEQANRAFLAMTQMMSKNQVMAEELRGQLAEALPQSIGIMAKSLGVTTQELGKMMESGQLIASEVLPKFAKEMEKALGGTAQEMATGMQAEIMRLENAFFELYATLGESVLVEKSIKGIGLSLTGLTAIYKGFAKVVAFTMAATGDNTLMLQILQEEASEKMAKSQNRIKESAEETSVAMVDAYKEQIGYEKALIKIASDKENKLISEEEAKRRVAKENEKLIKYIKAEINANEELLVTGEELNNDQVQRNFMLQANIDAMREELSYYEPSSKARERSAKEIKAEADAMKALVDMRRRAQLAEKTDVGKLKLKNEFEVQDLQSNPAFLALSEKEQTAILNEIDNQTNEQVKKLIEAKGKGLEKLKAYEKSVESEDKSGGIIAKIVADVGGEMGKELNDLKDLEQQKQAYRIEMAMQTFDLLSALNARYSQGQIQQLNEQLQQGIISQQAYEEQMRKIKRRQAVIDKAGALFQIGLNTAINATASTLNPALLPFVISFGALQAATVIASPIPYNKGTKRVPFARGAVRGKDSVHAILTPNERVVPESVNMQPGYSALMDLAQDRKISDSEAGFIADLATSGYRANNQSQTASIDYDLLGRSIAKYFPGTDVKIDKNGIAVISERHAKELKRRTSKL